jgi:ubiquinone/menaquinone biosynthesis C-methylase UbiE
MQVGPCYSPEYFSNIRVQSRNSASVVAPLVMQLLQPRSVVDVGCGTAAWAAGSIARLQI